MENSKKSCGCIVIKEDKVLLIQAKNDENELFWAFPKGEQESKETDKETALRETREEVGLEVEIIDEKPIRVGHLIHNGTAFKEIILFIAKPLSDELTIQKQEVESKMDTNQQSRRIPRELLQRSLARTHKETS